jgi:hypothetical protein
MAFDIEAFLDNHASNFRGKLTIKGYGSFEVIGRVKKGDGGPAIARLMANQEPNRNTVRGIAALAATQPHPEIALQGLCRILANQNPTENLLKLVADLVARETPNVYSLIEGQKPTRSTLKILCDLAGKQASRPENLEAIVDLVSGEAPASRALLTQLAQLVQDSQ